MSAPELHVTVSTVPWRRASCERLLSMLSAQSVQMTRLHLILDGYGEESGPSQDAIRSPVTIHRFPTLQGCGNRWRVALAHVPPDALLVNVDDDVILPSDFLYAMQAAVEDRDVAVCCSGYVFAGQYMDCYQPGTYPVLLAELGTFAIRAGLLRDLSAMPMADELLGVRGDDEGLLSACLWQRQIPITRIAVPGLGFDPSYADPRSLGASSGGRLHSFRQRLASLTGWPWH